MPDNVTGFVDGVVDGDLVGWIVNHSDPSSIEEVVCHGATGSRRFHAFHHHEGMCEILKHAGRFGFAIPLHQILGLGDLLRVTTIAGNPVERGELDLTATPADAHDDGGPVHVFLHIQKTAGTAIAAALRMSFRTSAFASIYHRAPWLNIPEFTLLHMHERQALRMICGHLYFGFDYLVGRNVRYLTFIRDPIRRIESHYWHLRRWVEEPSFAGRRVAHSTILNEALTEEFDNLQTRMIAGVARQFVPLGRMSTNDVDLAMLNIERCFDFVGISESAEADYRRMCALLRVSPSPLARMNVGTYRREADEDFQRLDWNRITYNNRFDIALYESLVSRDGRMARC